MAELNERQEVWRTINGRRVFIKKKCTDKDIKTIYAKDKDGIEKFKGYELNGIYLLKSYSFLGKDWYRWHINLDREDEGFVHYNLILGRVIKPYQYHIFTEEDRRKLLVKLANNRNLFGNRKPEKIMELLGYKK